MDQIASGPAAFHVAQCNVARMRAPLDHPAMASFVARLARLNALADRSPGFVWRLQTPSGNATAIRVPGEDDLLVNISVWETIESLERYTYAAAHGAAVERRLDWFEPPEGDHLVLWWVPSRHVPGLSEAMRRLDALRRFGPSPDAFTFRDRFPAPAMPPPRAVAGGD